MNHNVHVIVPFDVVEPDVAGNIRLVRKVIGGFTKVFGRREGRD